jgi:hypothetical protein
VIWINACSSKQSSHPWANASLASAAEALFSSPNPILCHVHPCCECGSVCSDVTVRFAALPPEVPRVCSFAPSKHVVCLNISANSTETASCASDFFFQREGAHHPNLVAKICAYLNSTF